MAPTPLSYVYCTEEDIRALISEEGEVGRVDDYAEGMITPLRAEYVTKAIAWATARINFFCASKYDHADLATSWVVNQWAVVLACDWLSRRRGNPSPMGDMVEEVMQDLKDIRSGEAQFDDIGLRTAAWPAWSNVTFRGDALLRRVKVQRVQGLSDMTTPNYRGNDDLIAPHIPPPN